MPRTLRTWLECPAALLLDGWEHRSVWRATVVCPVYRLPYNALKACALHAPPDLERW